MTIKISKKIDSEINRIVKNFNQKIARLEKLDNENLPKKIKKREILENYTNNGYDLRRKLKELKRFSERGAEEVAKGFEHLGLTNWEVENLKNDKATSIRNLKKQIKEYETIPSLVFGNSLGLTKALMYDNRYLENKETLEKIKNMKIKDIKDLEDYLSMKNKFKRRAYRRSNQILKENQFSALERLGYASGYPKEKLDKIKEKFLNMSTKNFINMFNNDEGVKKIMEQYRVYRKNISKGILTLEEMHMDDEIYQYFENLYEFVMSDN